MATTAVSSSASANASAANIVSTLGAGSGIDIKSLAQSLVDAEKAPRKAAIDKGVTKNEKIVSGLAAAKYALSTLQTAFDNLKDKSDYKNISVSNSQTNAFTATASANADPGNHRVLVNALAAAQLVTGESSFETSTSPINEGGPITLTLSGAAFAEEDTITVEDGQDTPAGIVDAINQSGKGLSAQLFNTGDPQTPYKIVVIGSTGLSNAFTISSSVQGLDFGTPLQEASDASLTVDGIPVVSSSNTLNDTIPGVTLNLLATNTSPASLSLTNNTADAKTKVLALVSAYNDAMDLLTELSNPKSTLDTYGGSLVGNSTVNSLRTQLRAMVTADSSTAASSGSLSALRDIGIEVNKVGKLTSNSVKLDMALKFDFVNTVTLLSGNQEDQAEFGVAPAGIAGDASKAISKLLSKSGTISTESANATSRITKYQDDLIRLEERMSMMLLRYNKQFSAMDNLVGQTKSSQTGLKSSFEGLMAMYTNN